MKDYFDECFFSKQDALDAVDRLIKFFQNDKKDKNFFGLDDLGIIDIYINSQK